jgi:hypothetical protein
MNAYQPVKTNIGAFYAKPTATPAKKDQKRQALAMLERARALTVALMDYTASLHNMGLGISGAESLAQQRQILALLIETSYQAKKI